MYVLGFLLLSLLLSFLLFIYLCLPALIGNVPLEWLTRETRQTVFTSISILCIIFPFYCIIPQFFIARWLTKKAKEGATLQSLTSPLSLWSCCLIPAIYAPIPVLLIVLLLGWMEILNQAITPPMPLVISEETTRITGPLTNDGYIDFFKALEQRFSPSELATDENGYRDFVRLFGYIGSDRKPEDYEFYRLQTYEKLGLDSDIPPTLVFPELPQTVDDESLARPWTLEEFPTLADWVNEIDVPLDAIAETFRKPVCCIPLLLDSGSMKSGIQYLTPNVITQVVDTYQFFRKVVVSFQARAGYRIGLGDIDGAIDDKISIMRFGRHYARIGGFMHHAIGSAFERMALEIPVGANPAHPPTEEQIRRLFAGLDALPSRTPITESIEWERHVALDSIQWLAICVGASRAELSAEQLQALGQDVPPMLLTRTFDWNVVFRRMNETFDAMHEPLPRTKLASILDGINVSEGLGTLYLRLFYSLLIPGARDAFMANEFIGIIAGSMAVNRIEARMLEAQCSENMQRLALAMLLYELEHGTMPGKDWTTQIGVPAKYFSCSSNPTAEGFASYAVVQYGNTTDDTVVGSQDTILLIELTEAVPLEEAVITVDEVLERKRWGSYPSCGMVAFHSGAVRSVWDEEDLLRMLGRE